MLIHQDRLARLCAAAIAAGADRPSLTRLVWKSLAGSCENPRTIELRSRPPEARDLLHVNKDFVSNRASAKTVGLGAVGDGIPLTLEMEVPCRQCARCLARRRKHWALRATTELSQAQRTWFCTFTLTPDEQYRAVLAARAHASRRRVNYEALTVREQFMRRHAAISNEISKYLKRLRKNNPGAKLRYLFVAEAHKSGDPHYHALIHEHGVPVRKKSLQAEWRLGFSQVKLVTDVAQATYLCKYLSKDASARVRASLHYGQR